LSWLRLEFWWLIVVSLALLVLTFFVRLNPLKAQTGSSGWKKQFVISKSSPLVSCNRPRADRGQIVALRFAADDELEELVSAVATGKLAKPKDIKQAIKNWRSDTFRV